MHATALHDLARIFKVNARRVASIAHSFPTGPAGGTELKAKRVTARDILNDKSNNIPDIYGSERHQQSVENLKDFANLLGAVNPLISPIKGAYEAYEGVDMFGRELSTFERVLGGVDAVLPFVGFLGSAIDVAVTSAKASRTAGAVKKVVQGTPDGMASAIRRGGDTIADNRQAAKAADNSMGTAATGKVAAETASDLSWIKCFSRDTLVHTATGPRPIGESEPGEQIWSYHFERGVWGLCEDKERLAPLVPMALPGNALHRGSASYSLEETCNSEHGLIAHGHQPQR